MSENQTPAIGVSMKRIDAFGNVTGQTAYPSDFNMDGQLWMKIRFSDRVHARVVSIDTRQAESYPGVVRIFTARDVPVNEYGLTMKDQPVICGPGSTIPGADVVRCLADVVAVVVADTEENAAAAAQLLKVEYHDLPTVFDPDDAMQDGAPQLHLNKPNNIIVHYKIRMGDMTEGWAKSDVIVENEFTTGYQEHAYLQPEAGLGYLDEQGRVTVVVAGQWVHEDQEQIYHALNLPPDQVRVIYPAIGGAFGGREDMSVQVVLALAAYQLGRPVKIIWSREESILYHHKRHPVKVRAKWGATRDGKLVAAEATVIGDAGAYNYTTNKVMGNAHLMVTGPYEIPYVQVDTYGVYTNNIMTGAFRGFGGPQGAFAAEGMMNRLAEALGLDPVEFRLRNVIHDGSTMTTGTPPPPGVTIQQTIEAGATESGVWSQTRQGWQKSATHHPHESYKRRGIGFACGF